MYNRKYNDSNSNLMLRDDLFCQYCGKQCKNLNSLKQHECRCRENPNRIKNSFEGKTWEETHRGYKRGHSWNYGLTKEIDSRIAKGVDTFKENHKLGKHKENTGKASSEEKEILRKQKISKSLKASDKAGGLRLNSGRGKKGWYKGIYCRSTYELVYVIYSIDHKIEFDTCKRVYQYEWNNGIHKYYPDFELPDGTIVEIKGYSNSQTEAKINSVTDRPIKVLFEKDLQYAFDYVKENYTYNKLEDLYDDA